MSDVNVKTRAQIAVAAIQDILRREDYQPQLLKDMAKTLANARNTLPPPDAVVVGGKVYPLKTIEERLAQFIHYLPPEIRLKITDTSFYDKNFLDQLISIIDEVSGFAPAPPPANIPQDLKNLVAEFEAAHQTAVSAQAKRRGWSPEKFREQIAFQNQITVQMGVVRQATLSQLGLVIDNSQYLENLAAALGRKPEVVKRLAKMRLQTLVDQAVTAQTFRQARSISINPSQLAALFTKNLSDNLKLDDLVDPAIRTNRQNAKKAIESIKNTVVTETETAKPAIQAAAENLQNHPSVQKTAQADAIAAVKQVETVSLGKPPEQQLKPDNSVRLTQQLVRHLDNSVQEKIIAGTLRVSPAQAKIIRAQLAPQINQLATSTQKFNPLLAADPDSIAADALRRPHLFPKPFVDAIKSGKITDAQVAEIFHMARLLDIPPNAVILSRFGVDAQNLAANLQAGKKWLGIIPMGHGLDPQDTSVVKLSHLAAAQKQLIDSLKAPPPLLPPQLPQQFLKISRAAARSVRLNQFFDQINPFRLPSALSYNLGRIPPLGSIGNSGSAFVSGFRVQSVPINSFFNFITSAGNAIRQAPSFLTAPFRAVDSAISNRIINPVKTWANTQIKSGLAKAGAWLAKKGVTEAAKKVGMTLLGKGTAALLAQAVPVIGQIAGGLMLLSTLGDIGKFLWQNRKPIGLTLGGLFFLGQMLLGKLFAAISGLANILGFAGLGAGIGFMVGGPVGALVGGVIGGLVGWGISAAGGLGAALSGLGAALGSAAAGLSSFIGALTAPSLVAGIPATAALIVPAVITGTIIYQNFFFNPLLFQALFVPPDEGTSVPGTTGAIFADNASCPLISPRIFITSYESTSQTGHGGNQYWQNVNGNNKNNWCSYTLPQTGPVGTGCSAPRDSGPVSGENECFLRFKPNLCDTYGFALDVVSNLGNTADTPVYLPQLDGQDVEWSYDHTFENPGVGWSHVFTSGQSTIVLTHLQKDVIKENPYTGSSTISSGTQIGQLFFQQTASGGNNTHLHLEYAIGGVYQRPEDFFCGTGSPSSPQGGQPIIVNCSEPGPYDKNFTPVNLASLNNTQLSSDVVTKVQQFIDYEQTKGITVVPSTVSAGYRTYEEQLALCTDCQQQISQNPSTPCSAERAAYSTHRTGRAIDLYILENGQYKSIAPLLDEAASFGLTHPRPQNTPHFYVP